MSIFSRILILKNYFFSKSQGEQLVNLLDKTFTIPSDFRAEVVRVTKEYVARPDLLSQQVYGDEMYSDILMKINGISNPYELNEDMYLVIPSIADIEKFVHKPSSTWSEPTWDTNKYDSSQPKTKSKTEKRKPNEAVTGDSRFNIDKASGVVIY